MPTCFNLVPDRFGDGRHEAMWGGLARIGYEVREGAGTPKDERDVLLTWTRHQGRKEDACKAFERQGGTVIVAEEGYIRRLHGEHWVALSLHDHNGAGYTPHGGPERWRDRFRLPLKPWRKPGSRVLVREQRGIGSSKMASPPDWHNQTAKRLQTTRSVEIRRHHKNEPDQAPLKDMPDVHAVVTWGSSIAVEALIEGIPVFLGAPRSIVEDACNRDFGRIDDPTYPDRLPALERMAWGQWSLDEIRTGEPFDVLLS